MIGIQDFMIAVSDTLKLACMGSVKAVLDILMQTALVALSAPTRNLPLLNNLGRHRPLTTHGVNAHYTALHRQQLQLAGRFPELIG